VLRVLRSAGAERLGKSGPRSAGRGQRSAERGQEGGKKRSAGLKKKTKGLKDTVGWLETRLRTSPERLETRAERLRNGRRVGTVPQGWNGAAGLETATGLERTAGLHWKGRRAVACRGKDACLANAIAAAGRRRRSNRAYAHTMAATRSPSLTATGPRGVERQGTDCWGKGTALARFAGVASRYGASLTWRDAEGSLWPVSLV